GCLRGLVGRPRRLAGDQVDRARSGLEGTGRLADGLGRATAVRGRGLPPSATVVDVHFADFMRDEVGTIRRIYERFGLDLTADAEARMRRYLAANPQERHGRHRYTLAAARRRPGGEPRRHAADQ